MSYPRDLTFYAKNEDFYPPKLGIIKGPTLRSGWRLGTGMRKQGV